MTKLYLFVVLCTFVFGAQEIAPDSVPKHLGGTEKTVARKTNNSMTAPVFYHGDQSSTYKDSVGNFIKVFRGNAQMIYQDKKLEAYEIEVHQADFMVYAKAKVDTLDTGEIKITGMPVFSEKNTEPMYAMRMTYDFKNQRGRVYDGKTTMDAAKYHGNVIRKFGEKTILIKDGKFTQCDADTPSYWFHASKIRMIQNEMLFTGPVFMHLHDIPFPIPLPFGVFSMKKGRRSGVIIPKYLWTDFRGRGLEDFGYYWALSDYMESEFMGSYFENSGFDFSLNTSFKKRYEYDGYLNLKYYRTPLDRTEPKVDEVSKNYELLYKYNHTFDPSFKITSSGTIRTEDLDPKLFRDFEKQVDQRLTSTFNVNKIWGKEKNTFSGNISFVDNLQTKQRDYDLKLTNRWTKSKNTLTLNSKLSTNRETKKQSVLFPELNFQHLDRELFGKAKDPLNPKWYEQLRYSYNFDMKRTETIGSKQLNDTTYVRSDTTTTFGAKHSPKLSFKGIKLFKYINFTPSVTYNEIWVDKVREQDRSYTDSLVFKDVNKFAALRTYSANVSFDTKLYGMIAPNIAGISAVRHTVSPAINIGYTPNFQDESFGYGVQDTLKNQFISKFVHSPYGSSISKESVTASISIGNSFDAKYLDSKGKEQKLHLFKASTRTSVNFLETGHQRWSDLATTFTFPSVGNFSFNSSTSHTFYKIDKTTNRKTDSFVFPKLKNATLSGSFKLDDKLFRHQPTKDQDAEMDQENQDENGEQIHSEAVQKDMKTHQKYMDGFKYDWAINFRYNMGYNPYASRDVFSKTVSGDFSTNLNLTKNWKVKYTNRFDVIDLELQTQSLSISRDLGCWDFSFNYIPDKHNRSYTFTIAIKEDMLKDIKYERRRRSNGIY